MTWRLPDGARATLAAVVPVIAPPQAILLGTTDGIVAHVERQLAALPTPMRAGFVAGLYAYDLGAAVHPSGRGRRARALPLPRAQAYFASWAHGPTPLHRQFARALRQLLAMATYEQPEMLAAIGYTPAAWIEQVSRRRLATYGDAVAAAAAARFAPDPLPGARPRRAKAAP